MSGILAVAVTRAAQTTWQISSMFCLKCVSFALFLIDEYILFFFRNCKRVGKVKLMDVL